MISLSQQAYGVGFARQGIGRFTRANHVSRDAAIVAVRACRFVATGYSSSSRCRMDLSASHMSCLSFFTAGVTVR